MGSPRASRSISGVRSAITALIAARICFRGTLVASLVVMIFLSFGFMVEKCTSESPQLPAKHSRLSLFLQGMLTE